MKSQLFLAFLFSATIAVSPSAFGASILLNAETPATGSNLASSPLITSLGTISFVGIIKNSYDVNMGSSNGHVFSTDNAFTAGTTGQVIEPASFVFGFDVDSITTTYGGNAGGILIQAFDGNGMLVDAFSQASTGGASPIGPVTLSGVGIRELRFEDPFAVLVALDNLVITAVPETTSMLLLPAIGCASLAIRRRPL